VVARLWPVAERDDGHPVVLVRSVDDVWFRDAPRGSAGFACDVRGAWPRDSRPLATARAPAAQDVIFRLGCRPGKPGRPFARAGAQ
jgi:hypothetical protein